MLMTVAIACGHKPTTSRSAVPQPTPGHPARVRAARASLAGLPPLALCGSYLDGVSISDTLVSGWNAGRAVC